MINVVVKQITVIYDDPKGPINRPNNPAQQELNKGKNTNKIYVKPFKIIRYFF
jgi:hypothetical protein